MANTAIAYVDGFNLYNGLHEVYSHRYLWLDLVALVRTMRSKSTLLKVKYFTATLLNDPDAQGRQAHYIAALEAAYPDLVEVVYGRYQPKPMTCKTCGAEWTSYEEKETDVNIAVALVSDVASKAATDFYIISGDSDLSPAVRQAQIDNPKAFCVAFFPPQRLSDELVKLMPSSQPIGRNKYAEAQFPETLVTEHATFARPIKWVPDYVPDFSEIKLPEGPKPKPAPPHKHYLT